MQLAFYILIAVGVLFAIAIVFAARNRFRAWCGDRLAARSRISPQDPALSTFVEAGNPSNIADEISRLLWDSESWIFRRVEKIEFLNASLARRHISVDFAVPTIGLRDNYDDGEQYVPISILRSWPPVHRFDLRDEAGRPLPLLSRKTTQTLDAELLLGLAHEIFGSRARSLSSPISRIVEGEGAVAARAFQVLRSLVDDHAKRRGLPNRQRSEFLALAAILRNSSLLWIRVDERERDGRDRRIVKLAYSEPVRRRLLWVSGFLASLWLRPLVVSFDAPHVGDTKTYHLEIEAPEGMEIVDARLDVWTDPTPPNKWVARIQRRLAVSLDRLATWGARAASVPSIAPERHIATMTQSCHMYVSSTHRRSFGLATVRFLPERRGTLTASVIVSALVTCTLIAFNQLQSDLFKTVTTSNSYGGALLGSSVAFLLIAPGLTTYVVLGSHEHGLTKQMLLGTRCLTFLAVLCSVSTAGALIWATAREDGELLRSVAETTQWISTGLFGVLAIGAIFPLRRSRQRSD